MLNSLFKEKEVPCPDFCPLRKNAVEVELTKCKIDMMSLNSQLLDAIQQKVNLSQQLEAWQVSTQQGRGHLWGLSPLPVSSSCSPPEHAWMGCVGVLALQELAMLWGSGVSCPSLLQGSLLAVSCSFYSSKHSCKTEK